MSNVNEKRNYHSFNSELGYPAKTFFLSSFEPADAYSPKAVEYLSTVSCDLRSDYVWVRVDPIFEPKVFGTDRPIDRVILAPRHMGESLNNPGEWPVHVYVCIAKSENQTGSRQLTANDLKIIN
jgi:hypothetical protein